VAGNVNSPRDPRVALGSTQSWVDDKPNTLRAFLRTLVRANDVLAPDRQKALDAMALDHNGRCRPS
jgi:ABC-type nitrate/sulfonate/bicarbonate transport system substrate-binding protein